MAAPHLIQFRISHYAEKVRWALDLKGIAHSRETLVPGFHIARMRLLTGQQQVPVLVIDGEPICGSAAILVRLEAIRPEPPLLPEATAHRARALALQTHFDTEVGPEVRHLFWSTYIDRADDCVRMATRARAAPPRSRTAWRCRRSAPTWVWSRSASSEPARSSARSSIGSRPSWASTATWSTIDSAWRT
jgi:glutathione S-transferase